HRALRSRADESQGGARAGIRVARGDAGHEPARAGPESELPDAHLHAGPDERPAAGVRIVRGRDLVLRAYAESDSIWVRSFDPAPIKCLVVCRGPVRLEAFEIFDAIGIREYGMLLSEKDSVTYPRCLAPELRGFRFPANVHRVPDYMGVGQAE